MSFAFNIDNVQDVIWNECVFTPEECQKIIEIGNKKELLQGEVGIETKDFSIRKNKVSWIQSDKESYFIYNKLSEAILEANKKFFNFNLWGFAEPLQFTKYESNNEYYGLHIDKSIKSIIRKLSISLQLSKPENYEGGDLIINLGKNNQITIKKTQGTIAIFPSYILHEVKPVTKGTRYSLVGWVTGEQFK
jgi:PKHD-type hydroxylase